MRSCAPSSAGTRSAPRIGPPSSAADLLCNLASGDQATVTTTAYRDPFLAEVQGSMRSMVHQNLIVSFAASTLARVAGCDDLENGDIAALGKKMFETHD